MNVVNISLSHSFFSSILRYLLVGCPLDSALCSMRHSLQRQGFSASDAYATAAAAEMCLHVSLRFVWKAQVQEAENSSVLSSMTVYFVVPFPPPTTVALMLVFSTMQFVTCPFFAYSTPSQMFGFVTFRFSWSARMVSSNACCAMRVVFMGMPYVLWLKINICVQFIWGKCAGICESVPAVQCGRITWVQK